MLNLKLEIPNPQTAADDALAATIDLATALVRSAIAGCRLLYLVVILIGSLVKYFADRHEQNPISKLQQKAWVRWCLDLVRPPAATVPESTLSALETPGELLVLPAAEGEGVNPIASAEDPAAFSTETETFNSDERSAVAPADTKSGSHTIHSALTPNPSPSGRGEP